MKRIKKLASLLLAMVMVLTMSSTVFASGIENQTGTFTITINTNHDPDDTSKHVYEAYQVFAGTLATKTEGEGENAVTTKYLSDITWGSGVINETELITALAADSAFTGCTTAKEVAEKLNGAAKDADIAQKFAAIVSNYLGTSAGQTTAGGNTISNLSAGYYLVKDQVNDDTNPDAITEYILEVVSNVDITPKSDVPTVVKKVKDVNDSTTGEETDWQDGADYDVNDDIDYQLTATMPGNYEYFETYVYTFTDTLSKGLTIKEDTIKVYVVNGAVRTEITPASKSVTGYTGDDSVYEGGHVLTVTTRNLKANTGVTKDSTIVVEYTCTLNENAVVGAAGNPNKVTLKYPKNPNQSGEGDPKDEGETPDDTVIVFTYDFDVNKKTGEGTALQGAGFTLKKWKVDPETNQGVWTDVQKIEAGTTSTFKFNPIDDGIYQLVEDTTPAGYNSIDPIYFMVKAEKYI